MSRLEEALKKRYFDLTKEFLEIHNISKYSFPFSYETCPILVDVDGDVDLGNKNLTDADIKFKFRNVTGNFNCSKNRLTSLKFAPDFVGSNFDCSNNELTSFDNAPEFVGGDFDCSNNKLTSLGNKPLCIVGDLYYSDNPSLPSLPERIFTNPDEEIDEQKFKTIGNITIKGSIRNKLTKKALWHNKIEVKEEKNNKNEEKEIDPAKKSLLAKMVSEKIVPRYLYRYCSLKKLPNQDKRDTINSHTKSILTANELYFTNPKEFNDPYDSAIPINSNSSKEEIKLWTDSNGLSENHFLVGFMQNYSDFIKAFMLKKIEDVGICCFSSFCDSILMWSHYADYHKGICLKFDILEDQNLFFKPLVVQYTKILPSSCFLDKSKKEVEKIVQRKFSDWSYESEVRILKSDTEIQNNKKSTDKEENQSRIFKFNNKALVEVIFGAETSKENIKIIKKLCEKSDKSHVTFSQMKLRQEIKDMKDNQGNKNIHYGLEKEDL
ncbi:MAG: DUF2971 domain-containing protein [Alphaproteobacteria bacterium]|nr:DUF2971 domain-containing protein [Alphaproteobacteria bacterium]